MLLFTPVLLRQWHVKTSSVERRCCSYDSICWRFNSCVKWCHRCTTMDHVVHPWLCFFCRSCKKSLILASRPCKQKHSSLFHAWKTCNVLYITSLFRISEHHLTGIHNWFENTGSSHNFLSISLSWTFTFELIQWLTENFSHYLSPMGIIRQIFDLSEDWKCSFLVIFFIFKLAMWSDWNEECASQAPYESTVCFRCCFPTSLFLCLSQTVAVSVCGRGKASFSMAHHSL